MKSGTKILVSLGVLILLAVPLISAGFFDWFKGDVQEAPYDVSVTVANAAPTVLDFLGVFEDCNGGACDDVDDDGATAAGTINGDPGGSESMDGLGTMSMRFKFVVDDSDNTGGTGDDLPGGGGGCGVNCLLTEGSNIIVTFTEPANDGTAGTNTVSAGAGDCSGQSCNGLVGIPICTDTSSTTTQFLYTCDIDINFFDPLTPNLGAVPADYWTILVTVKDSTGTNSDTAQSGVGAFTNLVNHYMYYNQIQSVATPGGSQITWSNLNINTEDQPSDDGTDLTMQNAGNIQILGERIYAYDLKEPLGTNRLFATAFGVSGIDGGNYVPGPIVPDTGACDVGGVAEGLSHDAWSLDVGITIPYTATGLTDTSTMYHCIWPAVNSAYIDDDAVESYIANPANSNQWTVEFFT